MVVRIPNSKGPTEEVESVFPILEAVPKRGGVRIPLVRGLTNSVTVIIPYSRAKPKCWNRYPQLKGPRQKTWESTSKRSEYATPNQESVSPIQRWDPQLKGPHQEVGVRIPN